MATKMIACVGDSSDHGGTIISTPQTTVFSGGSLVAVEGAMHSCPQFYPSGVPHGTTPIIAVTTKSTAA